MPVLFPGPSLYLRVAASEPAVCWRHSASPRQLTIFPAGEQHSLDFNGLRNFLSSLDSSRRDPPTELEVIAVMIMTMCNMHSISSSFIERSSIGTGHNPPLTRAPRCF